MKSIAESIVEMEEIILNLKAENERLKIRNDRLKKENLMYYIANAELNDRLEIVNGKIKEN